MEQKFIKLEDAIEKLGVSADRLNALRESGQLRAYRDGASWKFRADEIEKMEREGVPEPPPPSDIGLNDSLDLGDALSLEIDDEESSTAGSDLSGESGLELDQGDAVSDSEGSSDSILLSEEELGESVGPPGSTIVGGESFDSDDADLELALDDLFR